MNYSSKKWLWIFCPQMTLHDIPKKQIFGFLKKNLMWIFCPQMTLHDVPIHMWVFCPQMTLHHIPGVSGTFMFITWYLWVMTSRDKTKWPIVRATNVVSNKHKVKKFYWCMTSSEPKMCLWIFCPQMTLHDIPKIPQIGVNSHSPTNCINDKCNNKSNNSWNSHW